MTLAPRNKLNYLKLFIDDWRSRTLKLDLEESGLLLAIVLAICEQNSALPVDETALGAVLRRNPRTIRKLLPALKSAGYVVVTDDLLMVPDIEPQLIEHQNRSSAARAQKPFEPNSARIRAEFGSNSRRKMPKHPAKSTKLSSEEFAPESISREDIGADQTAPISSGANVRPGDGSAGPSPAQSTIEPDVRPKKFSIGHPIYEMALAEAKATDDLTFVLRATKNKFIRLSHTEATERSIALGLAS
jgi:hypothetical protein